MMDTLFEVLGELLTPKGGWDTKWLLRVLLSTTLLFGYIVVLARTFGSRTFATFTSYDFLTNVAAGSLVASAITGQTIAESSLSLLILVLLQFIVSTWSARSSAAQRLFDNEPVILIERGVVREEVMRRARVSPEILQQHLRQAGVTDPSEVQFAVLESGGSISVISNAS